MKNQNEKIWFAGVNAAIKEYYALLD